MEDMGPVDMHHDAGIGVAGGMAIARHMGALVDDMDAEARAQGCGQ